MLLVPTATGIQVPLKELADIEYSRGAQMIQSENTFLVGYVIFDKLSGRAEVDVVKEASNLLEAKVKAVNWFSPKVFLISLPVIMNNSNVLRTG